MTWWRHQMAALLAICAGNSPGPVNSPHKGQWRGALMFSLISAWINGWVNNRDAGDLRRNRAHYDVIVMKHRSVCCRYRKLYNCEYDYLWDALLFVITCIITLWFQMPFTAERPLYTYIPLEYCTCTLRSEMAKALFTLQFVIQSFDSTWIPLQKRHVLCSGTCFIRVSMVI